MSQKERPEKRPKLDTATDSKASDKGASAMQLKGPTQRYLLTVEYVGTAFIGWQKQSTGRTVQGELEDAFQKFVGQSVNVFGSSRTDTGVHALANTCHVDIQRISKHRPGEVLTPHDPAIVCRALNSFLRRSSADMAITAVRCVPQDFHARFQAIERTYHYRINAGASHFSVFEKDRAWHVSEALDLHAMQEACRVLEGRHDFSSFRASGCQAKSPLKTLRELSVVRTTTSAWPHFPSRQERRQARARAGAEGEGGGGGGGGGRAASVRQECSMSMGGTLDLQRDGVSNGGDGDGGRVGERGRGEDGNSRSLVPGDDDDASSSSSSFSDADTDQNPQGEGETAAGGWRSSGGGNCFVVTARAQSFLYHQVRLLVGTLRAVGAGSLAVADVRRLLDARDVRAAPAMAPASGLFLAEVKYRDENTKHLPLPHGPSTAAAAADAPT